MEHTADGVRGSRTAGSVGWNGGGGKVPRHQMLESNFGVQAGRRTSDGMSLGSTAPDVLERLSIAPNSVARLLQALESLGLSSSRPIQRVTNTAVFLGSIASREYTFPGFKTVPTVWSIAAYAKAARSDNITSTPNATSPYQHRRQILDEGRRTSAG